MSGGYSDAFDDRIVSFGWPAYLRNLAETFLGPEHGIFVWSPVLMVALIGARRSAWRTAPDWARASAVAAIAYLLVHAQLNRVSGGLAFNYRYALEALVLALPLLAVSARQAWCRSRLMAWILATAALVSVGLQAATVFLLGCEPYTARFVECGFF